MELGPTWDVTYEFPNFCVFSSPLVHNLRQMNPIHIIPSYISDIDFTFVFPPISGLPT
jgi:hypothetical protein